LELRNLPAGEIEKPFVLIRLRDASQPHWPNLLLLLLEPRIRIVFPLKVSYFILLIQYLFECIHHLFKACPPH
jgi:hypothetical protein